MVWSRLQSLTIALLGNDTNFPEEGEEQLAVLEYALHEVVMRARALRLETDSNETQIIKRTIDGVFIRKPVLPRDASEVVDIDNTLCFAVGRYMASILSFEPKRSQWHEQQAIKLINQYNTTIEEFEEGHLTITPRQETEREYY